MLNVSVYLLHRVVEDAPHPRPLPFTSAAINMFSGSPAKKTKSSFSSSARKFISGNPLWPCPSVHCDAGHLKEIRKNKGGVFAPCDQKNSQDPETCQVSCTILTVRGSDPAICELCLTTVGGTPSLGVLSGEKTSQGRDGEQLSCVTILHAAVEVIR